MPPTMAWNLRRVSPSSLVIGNSIAVGRVAQRALEQRTAIGTGARGATRPTRGRTALPMCACLVGWQVLLIFLPFLSPNLRAHTPSETFLTLTLASNGTNLTGQWDVALRDVQQGLGLEEVDVKAISAEELARRQEALALDTIARLEVKADGTALPLTVTDYLTVTLNSGEYARVQFSAAATREPPAEIELNARVLFAIDVAMHGVLRLDHADRTETAVFNAGNPAHRFNLGGPPNRWQQWATFIWEGVWHIWIGFDHILFLVALLLPAVLGREGERWVGVDRFRPAVINVLKIVTAFTLAHSITLSLAALEVLTLPSRLVESVIAASVALAAANNLWPIFRGKGWMVAFGFGLIHGFGFANVLGDLGLSKVSLAVPLVGFNVGVELGQLAIVAVFLPLAFGLRHSWFYRVATFKFGSGLVVLIAALWMVERMLGAEYMPF